jgi:hypothetical protein
MVDPHTWSLGVDPNDPPVMMVNDHDPIHSPISINNKAVIKSPRRYIGARIPVRSVTELS